MSPKKKPSSKRNASLEYNKGDSEFISEFKKCLRGEAVLRMSPFDLEVIYKDKIKAVDLPCGFYHLSVCRCTNCGKYGLYFWPAIRDTDFWQAQVCKFCLTSNAVPLICLPASSRGNYYPGHHH